MKVEITTVIPTYQRPALLARAIQSVLNQSFSNAKVRIFDNDSADDTAAVVERFRNRDGRVEYFRQPQNVGTIPNFNAAMASIDTPFFSILSDDDVLLPDFYHHAMAGFRSFPEAHFSVTQVFFLDHGSRFRGVANSSLSPGRYRPPDGLYAILQGNHAPTWTGILFRKEVTACVGFLDSGAGPAVDDDYIHRIAARKAFIVSNTPGAVFFSHPESGSATFSFQSAWPSERGLIGNIIEDSDLPANVKTRARYLLTRRLKRKMFFKGWQSMKHRSPAGMRSASRLLRRDLHAYPEAIAMASMAKACEFSSSAYSLLERLNQMRKSTQSAAPTRPAGLEEMIAYISTLEAQAADTAGISVGFARQTTS
jgi:glycosyltransferase involved in cell wall biosynthesis